MTFPLDYRATSTLEGKTPGGIKEVVMGEVEASDASEFRMQVEVLCGCFADRVLHPLLARFSLEEGVL
jgi:hypothetical protein